MKEENLPRVEPCTWGDPMSEVTIVVRPEERLSIMRVLETEVGAAFSYHHAVGRGSEGALAYGADSPKFQWLPWSAPVPALSFLPKIVFLVILETHLVPELLERLGIAIRLAGQSAACAGGFAVIAEIDQSMAIGFSPGTGCTCSELPLNCSSNDLVEKGVLL